MLKTVEKNFKYHEFYTDSENFVRDIARLLSLGYATDAILDGTGIIKPSLPVIDSNWQIIYPAIDKRQFPNVEDWDRLTPAEYEEVTEWQVAQITDSAIIKTKTLPKHVAKSANISGFGFDDDLNKASCEMHLEIYMPPYLCDTEADDPLLQKTGVVPRVLDPKGYDAATPSTKIIRNYYHAFFRIFDKINAEGTGPMDNEIDPVTNEIRRWNSRSSEWSKLAWYNDFEDKYISELIGKSERGMLDGSVRMPIEPGISMQTKIKLWANVNRDRLVLACMGSPNIDFSDERYLIGCAYIGAIDSFDFSINDTAGNFGIFTTSSSVPSIGETMINTRKARWAGDAVYMENPADPSGPQIIDKTVVVDGPTTKLYTDANQTAFQLKDLPAQLNYTDVESIDMDLPVLQNISPDTTRPGDGPHWGTAYIVEADSRVSISFSFEKHDETFKGDNWTAKRYNWGITYTDATGKQIRKTMVGDVATIPPAKTHELKATTYSFKYDENERKNVELVINTKELIGELKQILGIPVEVVGISVGRIEPVRTAFKLQTQYKTQSGGVTRDRFGNIIKVEYRQRYGKNSANGTTDFAMYHTFGKDYFQKHNFMFTSTEEFMQKELYGKSVYTGEYFADRIKVVHGSEGPRGILKAMITVDTSSLYPFDELIVNKDFKKYEDEPEELFVYLPVTAPYCPFANSPNGRHGIGILKEIRYPVPESDEDFVNYAIRELERKYGDLKFVTEDIMLIELSEYGVPVTWESSDTASIVITPKVLSEAKTKKGRE